MPQHYIAPEHWSENQVIASAREAHHLVNVLRVKVNDTVTVFDGTGRVARASVKDVSGSNLTLKIEDLLPVPPAGTEVILLQSIPKGKRMDMVVEKATELGAARIIPLLTARTVVRIPDNEKAARVERWKRVAVSAAEQCGTPRIPVITQPCTLDTALSGLSADSILAATLETATVPLKDAIGSVKERNPESVAVIIGPEGDLTAEEVALAEQMGAIAVSLGGLVLRSETAGIHAVGLLRYEFGE